MKIATTKKGNKWKEDVNLTCRMKYCTPGLSFEPNDGAQNMVFSHHVVILIRVGSRSKVQTVLSIYDWAVEIKTVLIPCYRIPYYSHGMQRGDTLGRVCRRRY